MANNEMISSVENDRILVLERVFDAPRDLVFRMFKEPEHLIGGDRKAGKSRFVTLISVQAACGTTA